MRDEVSYGKIILRFTGKDPQCLVASRMTDHSDALPLVWCGRLDGGRPAQLSSSSSEHDSEMG
ncbi:hypothetical protein AVEN_146446-1, partial [Araneus ventricosus]